MKTELENDLYFITSNAQVQTKCALDLSTQISSKNTPRIKLESLIFREHTKFE